MAMKKDKDMKKNKAIENLAIAILLYDFYRPVQADVWGCVSISVSNLPIRLVEAAVRSLAS
jgi:hypothetical protein